MILINLEILLFMMGLLTKSDMRNIPKPGKNVYRVFSLLYTARLKSIACI